MSKHLSDLSEFNDLLKADDCPLSQVGRNLGLCLIHSIERAGESKNVLERENVRCDKSLDTWIFAPFLTKGYQNKNYGDLHFKQSKLKEMDSIEDMKTLKLLTRKLTGLFRRDLGWRRQDLSITSDCWYNKQLVIEKFVEQLDSMTEKREGNGGN